MDVYHYIDEYLSGDGRSQNALAEKLGIPGRYLSDCRSGKQKPSGEVCEAMAKELVAAKVLKPEQAMAFQWHYSISKRGPRLTSRRKATPEVPALTG